MYGFDEERHWPNGLSLLTLLAFLERLLQSCVTLRIDKRSGVYGSIVRSEILPKTN